MTLRARDTRTTAWSSRMSQLFNVTIDHSITALTDARQIHVKWMCNSTKLRKVRAPDVIDGTSNTWFKHLLVKVCGQAAT